MRYRVISTVVRHLRRLLVVGLAILFHASGVAAQRVHVQLIDEFTQAPVSGALVLLLNASDDEVGRATSDEDGAFDLEPEVGQYRLVVVRAGHVDIHTPAFEVDDGSLTLQILVPPSPVPLEGLEVTVSPYEDDLFWLGLTIEQVGRRLITRELIDKHQGAKDIGEIIQWQVPPGVQIIRQENVNVNSWGPVADRIELCFSFPQARNFDGSNSCAVLVLDGRITSDEVMVHVDPDDVEAILVLRPLEARQLYGMMGNGGAIVTYTRRGRPSGR